MKLGSVWEAAAVSLLTGVLCAGCGRAEQAEERRPRQAGQPLSVVDAAANVVKARAGAAIGDQAMTRHAVDALSEDMRQSMRLPDPSRPIDREHARAVAKGVPGVRTAVWLDARNLLARVERNELRSQATIDSICQALEPLGDTLAVTVNLQSAAASTSEELETLQRNCQLAPGERAMFERRRPTGDIDPAIRAAHRANNDE